MLFVASTIQVSFEQDVVLSQMNEYEVLQLLMGDCRERLAAYQMSLEEEIKHNQVLVQDIGYTRCYSATECLGCSGGSREREPACGSLMYQSPHTGRLVAPAAAPPPCLPLPLSAVTRHCSTPAA